MKLDRIHEDKRGIIFSVSGSPLNFEEVSFLYTKAGYARGACQHPESIEHICVIEGTITYYYGDCDITLKEGDTFTIDKNVPHFFLSLTNSVVIEWGTKISEKGIKNTDMLKIVKDINENLQDT